MEPLDPRVAQLETEIARLPKDNRSATVRITFAGKRRKFRLAIGEMRQLEEACGVGTRRIARLLRTEDEKIDMVVEVLRLGLIGGGMSDDDADRLLEKFGPEDGRMPECLLIAQVVTLAAIGGSPVEDTTEKKSPLARLAAHRKRTKAKRSQTS